MTGVTTLLCVFFVLTCARAGDVFGDWIDSLKVEKRTTNDEAARVQLEALVAASEAFKAAHQRYPKGEDELLDPEDGPGYIDRFYDEQEIQGYEFSVEFEADGYQFIAKPVKCGESGSTIFIVGSGKETMELDCK